MNLLIFQIEADFLTVLTKLQSFMKLTVGHLLVLKQLSEKADPVKNCIDLMHIPTPIMAEICMEHSGINRGLPIVN